MVENTRGGTPATTTAPEIPSHYLPPVPYADLPEPLPLRRVLGPSVLLLGASIGSGEYLLWPYISTQTGLALVWLATIGILTQYFLNMEIERYTLATGETAVTGFARIWRHWSWLFVIMTILPWMWPGWATGSSTALTFALGLDSSTIVPITIASLVAIGIVLTASPVVYKTTEKIQFFLVGLIVLFIIYAAVAAISGGAWAELGKGFTTHIPDIPAGIGTVGGATLLGAIAFAGAGGTLNLAQSNWIRDKGLGMGSRIPKIVSPITGQEEATPSVGYFFPQDEANLRRWRGWWRLAHREQFVTFFVIGLASILIFMTLTYATLGGANIPQGFAFVQAEGEALKDQAANWVGTAFWVTGMVVLLTTNLALIDMVGRVTADIVKTNWLRASTRWTESRIYFVVVWAEIVFGSIILLAGVSQPLVLVVISSALNGIVMFVYSVLLIKLNRGVLPRGIRLGGGRLFAVGWAVVFYGCFSLFLVYDQARSLFG
ncbi:MAG: Nramp family divalent metal transporter [Streptosporangiales bacterium]